MFVMDKNRCYKRCQKILDVVTVAHTMKRGSSELATSSVVLIVEEILQEKE